MKARNKKTGSDIRGTLERLSGVAITFDYHRTREGKIEYAHEGGTDIFWDGADTATTPDGKVVFLDHDGDEVSEDDVELYDDAGKPEPTIEKAPDPVNDFDCCKEIARRSSDATDILERAHGNGQVDEFEQSDPSDLITNLLHMAHRNGGDVDTLLARARYHFEAERHGGDEHGI